MLEVLILSLKSISFDIYPLGVYTIAEVKKMEEHNCKIKHRDDEEKKLLINRINRIEGQIKGIKQMIENDVYCDDILIQISAVTNSTKSLGRLILNNHMKTCVKRELLLGNDEIIDEVIGSFSKLY